MSDESHWQELHENVSEFFPEYGSLQHSGIGSQPKKKGLTLQQLSAKMLTGAALVAMVVIPFVICHMLFVGGSTATISTKIMNAQPDSEVFYVISTDPRQSDEEILKELSRNPDQGTPVPEDGKITLQGLNPRTPYRLIFFSKGTNDSEGKPLLLGKYPFKTGHDPIPVETEPVQLQQPTEATEPPETEPTVPTTLPETEPPETTVETTEAATVPTETTRPTPPPLPPAPPVPPASPVPPETTEPPAPPETEPPTEATVPTEPSVPAETTAPTEPPAPIVSNGEPTVTFTERNDGKFVFTPEFPFSVDHATVSRAEFLVTRTHADGSVTETGPDPVVFTQSGTNVTVKFENAEVPLSESIRIQPTLYYKDAAGTETPLTGSVYEACPAGISADTTAKFRYDYDYDNSLNYTVTLNNIVNSATKAAADSSLVVESLEFIYIDETGNPIVPSQIVPLSDVITGQTYTTAGKVPSLYDVPTVQVKVNAAWKIGGQNALLTSSSPATGVPAATIMGYTPSITGGTSVPGTSDTTVTVSVPFVVENATPQKISITASDGSGNILGTSEGVPIADPYNSSMFSQSISFNISPGSPANIDAVLEYIDDGVVKTETNHTSISGGSMAPMTGNCTFHSEYDGVHYLINIYDIINPDCGSGSGMGLDSIDFIFKSLADGTAYTVPATGYTSEIFVGGFQTNLEKKGTVNLDSIPGGEYSVTAVVRGRWRLNNDYVQEIPTSGTVNCLNEIVTVPIP